MSPLRPTSEPSQVNLLSVKPLHAKGMRGSGFVGFGVRFEIQGTGFGVWLKVQGFSF